MHFSLGDDGKYTYGQGTHLGRRSTIGHISNMRSLYVLPVIASPLIPAYRLLQLLIHKRKTPKSH